MLTDRRRALSSVGAIALAAAVPACGQQVAKLDVAQDGGLRTIARQRGLLYGAAVHSKQLAQDAAFASAFAAECDVVVPEVEGKWAATQPARGRYDMSGLAKLLAFADVHRMRFRGHCLVWHESFPGWLGAALSSAGAVEARALLEDHIAAVAGFTRGRATSWDVVNEAIDPSEPGPDHMRRTPWHRALGPSYVDLAFHAARRADPAAKLVYNDFGTDYADVRSRTKRAAILRLLGGLRERNVPVDALGIQAHLTAGNPFDAGEVRTYVRAAAALGLDVYVTELDVEDKRLPSDFAARDAAIAAHTSEYLGAICPEPAFKGVITWGLSGRYSWLNRPAARRTDGTPSRGLPLDAELRRTAMWTSIANAMQGQGAPGR